jgi:hypothetical protein
MSYTGVKTFPLLAGTVASAAPWQALVARSGYRVYPFQLGAKVRGTSTGTAVTLYGQGAVALNDYVIFCDATAYGAASMFIPNLNKIRRVSAVSSSDDAITIDAAVSITAGDYMLVIGADTATTPETAPNYDGSLISLYSDNAGQTAVSPKYLLTTTGGSYIGWTGAGTKAVDLLITNSSGVPQIVDPFVAVIPNEEVNQIRTYTAAGATPSVAGFKTVKVGQSGGVTITNLTGGTIGQQVTLFFTDANTTIASGTNFALNSGVTSASGMLLTLLYDGTKWYEVSRSTGGGGSVTAYVETELTQWTTLSGSAANIDFTSISQSYTDLIVRLMIRSDRAGNNTDAVDIKFNNDSTGANYQGEFLSGTTNSASASRQTGGSTGLSVATCPAATSTSGYFGYVEIEIPLYTSSKLKTFIALAGNPMDSSTTNANQAMGQWLSTAAISRITLTPSAGSNWITGTSYQLTGRTSTSV